MDDDIPGDLKAAILSTYTGWELVALLDISIEDVVDAFESDILDHVEELREELRMEDEDEEE